jgi:predicted amidohydrolase YtcJ
MAREHKLQLCIHAIGDRANQVCLDIIEGELKKNPSEKPLRWRIEHAQHLDPDDIPRFKKLGVIAAMQAVHCTSDAPFVVKRLGEERARKGAYAWRSLLDAGAVVTNGTDAPVEDVDPLRSFYAAVTRRRADNGMIFFPEQKISRKEAIYSYTLANAYAAFEEQDKGSLSKGKLADLVVLSEDLRNCPDEAILGTKVLMTVVGGKVKYRSK